LGQRVYLKRDVRFVNPSPVVVAECASIPFALLGMLAHSATGTGGELAKRTSRLLVGLLTPAAADGLEFAFDGALDHTHRFSDFAIAVTFEFAQGHRPLLRAGQLL
jgi:hypothetical protein